MCACVRACVSLVGACSLDPAGDPVCVLLMLDYYALRSDQYQYLLTLFEQWEVKMSAGL